MNVFRTGAVFFLTWATCFNTVGQPFTSAPISSAINTDASETCPVLGAAGNYLFFSREDPSTGEVNIWYSELEHGGWVRPIPMDEFNSGRKNYLLSLFCGDSLALVAHDKRLQVYRRENDHWVTATSGPPGINASAISSDGHRMIQPVANKLLIFRNINGSWIQKESIEMPNVKRASAASFNDSDSSIYVTGLGTGGTRKDIFKLKYQGSHWTTTHMIGHGINSPMHDQELRTSVNGSRAVFASNRSDKRNFDIYFVKLYEDRPYVLVKGRLINGLSSNVVTSRNGRVLVNGEPAGTSWVDTISGSYSVHLPFGEEFNVQVEMTHFTSNVLRISTKDQVEHDGRIQDITLQPLGYARLRGELALGKPLSGSRHSIIVVVNGEPAPLEATSLSCDNSFHVDLPLGKKHKIYATINGFATVEREVDLLTMDAFSELSSDFPLAASSVGISKVRVRGLPSGAKYQAQIHGDLRHFLGYHHGDVVTIISRDAARAVLSVTSPGFCPALQKIASAQESVHDVELVPIIEGTNVKLRYVEFELGKTTLMQHSAIELDVLIKFLSENPAVRIEIGAHTHNASRISTLARAKAVADYCFQKGIARNRISIKGFGSTKPLVPHAATGAREINNRIEYTILEK